MDSIIRMSRHKNGPEKDVYAPRFQKVNSFFLRNFQKIKKFHKNFKKTLEHSTNFQSSRKVTDASPAKRKNEKSYSILAKWQHLPGAHYRNARSAHRSGPGSGWGFCTNGEFSGSIALIWFSKFRKMSHQSKKKIRPWRMSLSIRYLAIPILKWPNPSAKVRKLFLSIFYTKISDGWGQAQAAGEYFGEYEKRKRTATGITPANPTTPATSTTRS